VRAQLEDPRVDGADVGLGVGLVVVEALLQRERLVEVAPRLRQRLRESGGRVVAELRRREAELLLARPDGVVGCDQRAGGAARERLDRFRGCTPSGAAGAASATATWC